MEQNKKYFAFISYSHEDEEWAKWLQHEFEHYHLPVPPPVTINPESFPDKFHPIFRDIYELSGGELNPQITDALKSSTNLIVICSPNSAKSNYVNEEILEFIEIGKQNGGSNISNIFPLIVCGIPNSKDNSENECFPKALRDLPTELIAGDVTKHGREHAFVKVLSGTLRRSGVSFGMLWNQFERDRIEAERKERERKDQLLRIQSLFLAEKAESLIDHHEYDLANLIALEALPNNLAEPNRPYVREVEDSLRKSSVYTSPIIRSSIQGRCIQTNGEIVITEEENCRLKLWDIKTCALIDTIDLEDWLKEYYKDMLDAQEIDSYILRKRWLKSIAFPKAMHNVVYLYTLDSLLSIDLDVRPQKPQLLFKRDAMVHDTHTADVVFSNNGCYYFWLTKEYTNHFSVSLYDNITNQKIFNYIEAARPYVAFSPNNKLIACACYKDIHVYDIENLKTNNSGYLAKYRCYDPLFCTFVDDVNVLVVRGNKSIEIWNFESKNVETIYTSDTDILDVLYKDNLLVFVTSSQQIRVLDTQYKLIIARLDWSNQVRLLSFSHDGSSIYFRDASSFRMWDFHIRADGSRVLYYHSHLVHCVGHSQDMSYFVSISEDCAKIWDTEQQKIIKSIALEDLGFISKIVVSKPHGKIFMSGYQLYCADISSGSIKQIADEECNICLSFDEKYLLKSTDNIITIYDIESLTMFKKIILPDNQDLLWGESIVFHPNETLIVTASRDIVEYETLVLTVWDYVKGAPINSIRINDCFDIATSSRVVIRFSDNGDSVILNEMEDDVYEWCFRANALYKINIQTNEPQYVGNIIEGDGVFVVLREQLSLQQLMDKTRAALGGRTLTLEERNKYYLI